MNNLKSPTEGANCQGNDSEACHYVVSWLYHWIQMKSLELIIYYTSRPKSEFYLQKKRRWSINFITPPPVSSESLRSAATSRRKSSALKGFDVLNLRVSAGSVCRFSVQYIFWGFMIKVDSIPKFYTVSYIGVVYLSKTEHIIKRNSGYLNFFFYV